jgi:hypothetical protein
MEAFAPTLARPHGGGRSEDFAVFTALTPDEEAEYVSTASLDPGGITGTEQWIEFFLRETVEVFPTTATLSDQLQTSESGNVGQIVSGVSDFEMESGATATRYMVELFSDYGRFVFDRIFVGASVRGCGECTGFVIQAAVAGRSSAMEPDGGGLPAANYPREAFEQIARSFSLAPAALPDTGGPVDEVESEGESFHTFESAS